MEKEIDIQFFQLVLSLQAAAMQQMGKVAHPMSGKVERDMSLAKNSIDMLEMFERKTRGNLAEDEKRLLDHVLYELRLNYVDEVKRDHEAAQTPSGQAEQPGNSGESSADNS